MKMKIERPRWMISDKPGDMELISLKVVQDWFSEVVEPISKMLAEGVEVYGYKFRGNWSFRHNETNATTHKALLIKIEPIKQETTSDVLKEWLSHINTHNGADLTMTEIELMKRARAALARESSES